MTSRLSFITRSALLVTTAAGVPALFACLDHPLKKVQYDQTQEGDNNIQLTVNKDVDILFVIDNSGSMGEEQALLSSNFASFINVLEDPTVKANYRIGVTTTDNGNPACSGTGPEGGKLQSLTSCRTRQNEFVFAGTSPPTDATDAACLSHCAIDDLDIQPTTTEVDATPKVHAWLENIDGRTNLPDTDGDGTPDFTTTEAFQCFGPQGIAGCGFESHLESMYLALLRAGEKNEAANFGFVRESAILSVVIISDEVDCSFVQDHGSIFRSEAQGGNEVFWSPLETNFPTSAVCWNAGVVCTGDNGTYSECHASNKNEAGEVDVPDSEAVLQPLSRYIGLLEEKELAKKEFQENQEVLVALITGIPANGNVTYQDGTQAQQKDFGIGPGCTRTDPDGSVSTAFPPVRMLEFADAFKVGEDPNVFSICADDFSPALRSIANAIRDQLRPACMAACVADGDPLTEQLDPECRITQSSRSSTGSVVEVNVPECGPGRTLPDGKDVCYVTLIDPKWTPDDNTDDMSDTCLGEGWNLEFDLVRRPGVPAPGGTSVSATCSLSQQKEVDCPNLPL